MPQFRMKIDYAQLAVACHPVGGHSLSALGNTMGRAARLTMRVLSQLLLIHPQPLAASIPTTPPGRKPRRASAPCSLGRNQHRPRIVDHERGQSSGDLPIRRSSSTVHAPSGSAAQPGWPRSQANARYRFCSRRNVCMYLRVATALRASVLALLMGSHPHGMVSAEH